MMLGVEQEVHKLVGLCLLLKCLANGVRSH